VCFQIQNLGNITAPLKAPSYLKTIGKRTNLQIWRLIILLDVRTSFSSPLPEAREDTPWISAFRCVAWWRWPDSIVESSWAYHPSLTSLAILEGSRQKKKWPWVRTVKSIESDTCGESGDEIWIALVWAATVKSSLKVDSYRLDNSLPEVAKVWRYESFQILLYNTM